MWRSERRRETSINVSSIESEIIGDMNECSDGVDRETRRGRWLRRVRRGEEREEDV